MKEVNGFVHEPMATQEQLQQQQQQLDAAAAAAAEVVQDHQVGNNVAAAASPIPNGAQEFSLAIKPKGLPLFKISALYKSRLKACIFLHFLLFFTMLAKLSEDILDRMDIFILELEELFIPKPLPFEYLWMGSIVFAIMGLRGLARNRLATLNSYAAGTVVLGVCPLIGAAIYFYSDVAEYADKKGEAEIEKWQGFPIALWWYGFIMVALQVHLFSLYFTAKLIKIWRVKMKRA